MRKAEYEQIVATLTLPICACPNVKALATRYGVSARTIESIYSQECQRRVIHGNQRLLEQISALNRRYLGGEDFISLCWTVSLTPCHVLRRLLECTPWSCGRQRITEIMRRPELVLELAQPHNAPRLPWGPLLVRLCADIRTAVECDPVNNPEGDAARRAIGLEYEELLEKRLEALGLPFWSEDALRAKGFFKTPDVKFQVPIQINGHSIFWIDSKATFGSDYVHWPQMQDQFQKYVNRYGAGLVVYWFGFVDELADSTSSVVLGDDFPGQFTLTRLPALSVLLNVD